MSNFRETNPATPLVEVDRFSKNLDFRNTVMGLASSLSAGRATLFGDRFWAFRGDHMQGVAKSVGRIIFATASIDERLQGIPGLASITGSGTRRNKQHESFPTTYLWVIANDTPTMAYVDAEGITDVLVSETNATLESLGSPYELPLILPDEIIT